MTATRKRAENITITPRIRCKDHWQKYRYEKKGYWFLFDLPFVFGCLLLLLSTSLQDNYDDNCRDDYYHHYGKDPEVGEYPS